MKKKILMDFQKTANHGLNLDIESGNIQKHISLTHEELKNIMPKLNDVFKELQLQKKQQEVDDNDFLPD